MFYLHFMDGSRVQRGSVVAITESEIAPTIEHNVGGSKLVDENGIPDTFDNSWKLGPLNSTKHHAKSVALAIAREINCVILLDGKVIEPSKNDKTMTVAQAEDYAREVGESVTGRAIRKAAKKGHIPGAQKNGRDWLIPYTGFNHYLDNRPKPGPVSA